MKSTISMTKTAFNKKKVLFTSKLEVNLRKKLSKCYIWSTSFYGTEIWHWKVELRFLKTFDVWCWRRMEKISWTASVRNEAVLQSQGREGYLKHVTEGKIEGRI